MAFQFTGQMLGRVCDQLLGVQGWRPAIDDDDVDDVLETLGMCDSHLERMYLLGALHRIEFLAMSEVPLWHCMVDVAGVNRRGLWFACPWEGFRCPRCEPDPNGPSSLVFVPQLPIRGKVWDFGILSGHNNGDPQGDLFALVEVDGYAVHRDRRRRDLVARKSASQAGVTVFSAYEESHSPSFWFDAVIHHWWHRAAPSDCPAAATCDVLLPEPMEAA